VYFGGAVSSSTACSEAFHGASSFSEAENRSIRHILEQFPNVLVGVDAHSFGEKILRPSPVGGPLIASLSVSAADDAIYDGLEGDLFNAIQAVNGVSYSTGSTSNHAGTSDEYMFFAHRVFGFNTECATSFQPAWRGQQKRLHACRRAFRRRGCTSTGRFPAVRSSGVSRCEPSSFADQEPTELPWEGYDQEL
jgi:hypothetical protein